MKNYRSKLVADGTWRAQYRFWLFYFIPTPFWMNFGYEFGDDMLIGLPPTLYKFSTKEECDSFLSKQ